MRFDVMISQPTTTILLAPSGAGKTTRIQRLKKEDGNLVHIYRDKIVTELLQANGIDGRKTVKPEDRERIRELVTLGDKKFCKEIENQIYRAPDRIIIDYPPSGTGEWIRTAIRLGKEYHRRIVIEGLHVDPRISLPRVLQRNSEGLANIDELAMLGPDRNRFVSWLQTYKDMPELFLQSAEAADAAILFDNNRAHRQPTVIAEWHDGDLMVSNRPAFAAFERLTKLNLQTARFDVARVDHGKRHGRSIHSFEITTSGFYDSELLEKLIDKPKRPVTKGLGNKNARPLGRPRS